MTAMSSAARAGALVLAAACAVFVGMWLGGLHEDALALPAVVGWMAALAATRPLVADDRRTALYFAFGVMAFLMFFLHETYKFEGAVRTFPLIVGWTGAALSALDILSLTETRIGRAIGTFFGSTLTETPGAGRSAGREVACFAAMGGGVVLVWLLGFLIGSPLFVFLWMWLWGRKPVRHAIYGGVGTLAFIWLLFTVLLQYELYPGILVEWALESLEG